VIEKRKKERERERDLNGGSPNLATINVADGSITHKLAQK